MQVVMPERLSQGPGGAAGRVTTSFDDVGCGIEAERLFEERCATGCLEERGTTRAGPPVVGVMPKQPVAKHEGTWVLVRSIVRLGDHVSERVECDGLEQVPLVVAKGHPVAVRVFLRRQAIERVIGKGDLERAAAIGGIEVTHLRRLAATSVIV